MKQSDRPQKAIAYLRVSTREQSEKGYGLKAQEKDVYEFAQRYNLTIVRLYKEVKSGKINERPILHKAIADSKRVGAPLLVPKVDRLSRIAWFGIYLLSTMKILVVDAPFAHKLTLYFMAIIAEIEGDLISIRTKDGLSIAKSKGIKFGTGVAKTHAKARRAYKKFAQEKKAMVEYYYSKGFTSVHKLKEILNKNKVKTIHGKRWHNSSVHRLLKELKYL